MPVAFDAYTVLSGSPGNMSALHTPVGVPRGILVSVLDLTAENPSITATYGGVTMRKVAGAPLIKTAAEAGAADWWFLGSGIPTGAQTVFVGVGGAGGTKGARCYSLTAETDLEIVDIGIISSDSAANPGVTLALGGRTAWAAIAFLSGQDAVSGVAPVADWTADEEIDVGVMTAGWYHYDTVGSTDVVAEWTQTADDAIAIAVAVGLVDVPDGSLLLRERFAGSSYQRSGEEFIDAPAAINSDYATSNVSSPPLWGTECALFTHSAANRCFIAYRFRNERVKTVACEFILTAESLADDGIANILSGKHDGYPNDIFANNLIWRFQVQQIASDLRLIGLIQHDGNANIEVNYAISLNTRYRLEIEWNLDAATWAVWINEALVDSGTITANPLNHPWELTDVQPGGADIDTAAASHAMGPLLVYTGPRSVRKWRDALRPQGLAKHGFDSADLFLEDLEHGNLVGVETAL